MNNPICNTVFDTRDLIEYKEYLEESLLNGWNEWQEENLDNNYEAEDVDDAIKFFNNLADNGAKQFLINYSDEISEYDEIEQFCSELENYAADFSYGETVIHESYFEEYCEEFCKDVGYLPNELPGFLEVAIDWTKVADQLEMDYTRVVYQGDDYLVR